MKNTSQMHDKDWFYYPEKEIYIAREPINIKAQRTKNTLKTILLNDYSTYGSLQSRVVNPINKRNSLVVTKHNI